MFNNTKNIFLFILLTFVVMSCEEDAPATEQDMHTDAEGMEIVTMITDEEGNDVEGLLYSECKGVFENNLTGLPAEMEWDLTVHFLDDDCEELEGHEDEHDDHDHGDDHSDDEPYLEITGYDPSIISITVGGHDDHDDHGDEHHCEDFTTEAECAEHDECEWHAADDACEDAHDHGEDHDDHDDHDEEHGYTFELESLAPGTTSFTVTLMHQGHADYTSPSPITITVE